MANLSELLLYALLMSVLLSAFPLGASMIVGLIVSVLQAATQVQEQTLSFVPKLITVILVILVFGSLAVEKLTQFFQSCLVEIKSISELGLF